MHLSLEWLAGAITLPPGTSTDDVTDALLRIGFEVEGVHTVPPTTGDSLSARVLTIEELTGLKKPIRFCTVDVGPGNGPDGTDEPRGIICGATNFVVGDTVVVALPGAVLPGGFAIASRTTYGRISDGMICSTRELGIGTEHDGILVIGPIAATRHRRAGLDRFRRRRRRAGDHTRTGVTRCRSAAWPGSWPQPSTCRSPTLPRTPCRRGRNAGWPVTIADPVGCGRFVTVRVSGIDPAAPSPFWLRRRLSAAGIRSISLAVDVTNYVMLDLGPAAARLRRRAS